jgi:hypothetical protein
LAGKKILCVTVGFRGKAAARLQEWENTPGFGGFERYACETLKGFWQVGVPDAMFGVVFLECGGRRTGKWERRLWRKK